MIKEVEYQTKAVKDLIVKTRQLLESAGERKRLVSVQSTYRVGQDRDGE